ncbi:MAG: aa3-type cytochrome oxidase subunit IV [Acidimicrobiales bacterium]
MRLEMRTCFGAALFLGVTCAIYWFLSNEDTGTACLLFSFGAYALIGGYLLLQWRRRKGIPRPEDQDDADMSDGAGEVGFFPSASVWPAGIGLGAIMLAVGLIYGTWYIALGLILVFGSVIGFVVEAEAREEGPDDPGMPIAPGDASPPITSTSVPSVSQPDR